MHVPQVRPDDRFPSGDGRPLATLRFSPEELATRFGLTFEEDYDDLDWFDLAAIALPDRSQAWLMRHRGNPEPGTTVYVDASAHPARTKELVQQVLGLADEDFCWIAPAADAPAVPA